MRDVIIALAPAILVSVLFYGWSELLVLGVSVASCVLIEWAITKWMLHRPSTIGDLSAVVTGLLLAMNLPATTPWWIVFIGALVAIGVAKMTFGGLGQNVFNPAITGRVFLLISFPTYMTDWSMPSGFVKSVDAVSGATPLSALKEALLSGTSIPDFMQANNYTWQTLLTDIGGSAGEISAIALLVGFAYLLSIDPAAYTGVLFNLKTGGLILGACFMATDYVTSPMSRTGGIIYGIGIGFIVMMIRYFGSYPEGVSFAILIMNCVVPLLNNWFHQKKYGRN